MSRDQEIEILRRRLDRHIGECRLHTLENEKIEKRMLLAQEANTTSIAELTAATKGLVELYTTVNTLQRFGKWISGFAFVGVLLAWWNDLIKLGSGS